MPHAMTARRRNCNRLLVIVSLYLIAAGCGGGGCSCLSPLPNGFPSQDRHANAIQARLTTTGVAFIENNASALVGALVPGGLNFDIPESCGGNPEVCCGLPPGSCGLEINLDPQPGDPPRLELTPRVSPDNQLGVVLRARIRTTAPMPIKYDTGLFTADCDVELDTTWAGVPSVTIVTDVNFNQDVTTATTRIAVGAVDMQDLDDGDIVLSGSFTCDLADFFKGFFIDQIISGFTDQIGATIEDQVCKKCETDATCNPFGTCNADGVCELNDAGGQRCVQEIGASGRMAAANLLAGLSPGQPGEMDIYDVAGGYAKTNDDGLSLGILGGAIPADGRHDPCVPVSAPPTLVMVPEVPQFKANSGPAGAFDIGIGLHEYYLNLNGWAAYESGFLCANVGTRSIDLINSGTFSILVPSLSDYLHQKTGPLILALRPQTRPVMTLGLGTFTIAPNGDKIIDDPLITITMNQLQIDFYAQVDQRYIRIFTLQTDLVLPIGLDVDGMGSLLPVMGDLEGAFGNIVVTNSELMAETAQSIADKFPAVLSIALPFVADALGAIALPEIAGLNILIPPGGITSVENKTFLAIFGNLAVAMAKPVPRANTTAEIKSMQIPATAVFSARTLDRARRPVVELDFGGLTGAGDDRGLEWQYRVDEGVWSPYTTSPTVGVSRDTFWLQGRHRIEVRAREIGLPMTTDLTPVVLEPLIDTIAPDVALDLHGAKVTVDATDLVSDAESMTVAYRYGAGEWIDVGTVATAVIPVSGDVDLDDLEVAVTDEAGNTATGTSADFHGRTPSSGGCSCRTTGGGSLGGGLLLVLGVLLSFPAVRRRGRRGVLPLLVLAAVAVWATGCNCSSAPPGDDPNIENVPRGPTGQYDDIAAVNGQVVVSAYEEMWGDLVIVRVVEGQLEYEAVDGIPDVEPLLDPGAYRRGINEEGDDVGAYTSIALHDGQVRVSYQDITHGALRYASQDGNDWNIHVVDSGQGGVAGYYTSLSLDSAGVPGIAYMVHNIDDGAGGRKSELRWAQASTTDPLAEQDWTVSILHEEAIPCAGLCGDDAVFACVAETNLCAAIETTCAAECTGDTACVGGNCVAIVPTSTVDDFPDGTGLYASAGRLPDGRPVVAFYDRVLGDLNLAVLDTSGAWIIVPLDAEEPTDRGQWSSLAVAPDGIVHVAYQDSIGDRLLYITWDGVAAGAIEVIDDGLRDDRPHPVGASASLVLDGQGGLSVAYQDAAQSDMLFARRTGGAWTRGDLMSGVEGYGFWIAATADGNTTWVSSLAYDRADNPLGQLRVVTLP